jgi:thiamine biosynthesis lipoprotein
MGTAYSVKVVTGPEGLDIGLSDAIEAIIREELDTIDAHMSTWRTDSELSRFNASTSLEPFPVSDDTLEVLRWSLEISAVTGGAMDVTVAPLVDAWGFGPDGRTTDTPSEAELAAIRARVGYRLLELDEDQGTVRRLSPGVRCDVSALAAGYAADRIWEQLSGQGLTDFLIDVGGELRTRGRNDAGQPWQIAVEVPQDGGRSVDSIVPISDMAIATSGDYRNYYEVEGRRIAHILDPRTGEPLTHRLASVTVVDDLAVRADALSTALMVLGPEAGFAFAIEHDLAAAFIVREEAGGFARQTTPRLEALIAAGTSESDPAE